MGANMNRIPYAGAAVLLASLAIVACLVSSCATLSQVAALRKVDFSLDRMSGATIAGVRLEGKRSYSDLSALEIARLVGAVTAKNVPLVMTVHVRAENPADNRVTARLVQFDWTLYVKDLETVSGRMTQEYLFPPGQATDVPVAVQLDLWHFFGGRAQDLFDLAMSAAGVGGPTNISLKATPTIQTPIGPIRYPTPITIVQRTVGGP
jgi:hypothetical protein